MPRLDATGLSSIPVLLALAAGASAQSGFRPLPHLPRLDPWIASESDGESPSAPDASAPQSTTTIDAELFAAATAEGDLEGGGAATTQRGGWSATLGRRLDQERVAALELTAEANFYDFRGPTTLVAGDTEPFNDLYRACLCGQLRTQVDARLSYFAGVELELGGEDGSSIGETLSVGAAGGATITSGEHLSLSLGIAALSQLEDDLWLWPWLGLEWRPNAWLEIEAQGTELETRAKLGEHWTARARVDYTLRQYRLSDDNLLPGGALRDEDIRAGLGLDWQPDDGVKLGVLGGLSLWRELTAFDGHGGSNEQEIEASPFVAFELALSL